MIIQILLSLALLILVIYAYTQRSRSRLVAWGITVVCVFGEGMVLAPNAANDIAHAVGVGRGADLILYCFIVASLALVLNLHLRLHAMTEDMTEIARNLALLSAQRPTQGATGSEPTP